MLTPYTVPETGSHDGLRPRDGGPRLVIPRLSCPIIRRGLWGVREEMRYSGAKDPRVPGQTSRQTEPRSRHPANGVFRLLTFEALHVDCPLAFWIEDCNVGRRTSASVPPGSENASAGL